MTPHQGLSPVGTISKAAPTIAFKPWGNWPNLMRTVDILLLVN